MDPQPQPTPPPDNVGVPQQPTQPVFAQPSGVVPGLAGPAAASQGQVAASRKKFFWAGGIMAIVLLASVTFLVILPKPNAPTSQNTLKPATQTTPEDQTKQASQKSVVATRSSDLDAVCSGQPVSNTLDYTSKQAAILVAFHNFPSTQTKWTQDIVGYGKSYFLKDLKQFETVSVVACAQYVDGSASDGIRCTYNAASGPVDVQYMSTRFQISLYEAKTANKITDGAIISVAASSCPTMLYYDSAKKAAYATPTAKEIESAIDAALR